ncbi:MAG: ABATE domain-containing protein [Chloroflexi bacterium]|nr:ABATE domain-containing protein [Chloroflexota bacterium]
MSSEYVFDLDAGRLCLDFANTLSPSSGEHLKSYVDVLAFARQAQLLTPDEADRLQQRSEQEPHKARRALQAALQLRHAIREIFFAIAAGGSASEEDVAELNRYVGSSLAHARLVPERTDDDDARTSYRWGWAGDDLEWPTWPVCRSAADLLTNDAELKLVRQCGGSTCEWLFLDNSKNRSRQWCSMQSCGNREKARRHYQRLRAAQHGVSSRR